MRRQACCLSTNCSSSKPHSKAPSVDTPVKPTEARAKKNSDSENEVIPAENVNPADDKKRNKMEIEDSDCEDGQDPDDNVQVKDSDPTATKKKRRSDEKLEKAFKSHLMSTIYTYQVVYFHTLHSYLSSKLMAIDRETMSDYFHMPIGLATKRLNVSLTVFKKQCRQAGIERWPYPKLKSLHNMITAFQFSLSTSRMSQGSSSKTHSKDPSVDTPVKPTEARGKKLEIEDSDGKDGQNPDDNVQGKDSGPTATKKKRRSDEKLEKAFKGHLMSTIYTYQVIYFHTLHSYLSSKHMAIDRETMSDYFHMPIGLAAKRLNIGLTIFKKQCREVGIERWPYPKLKSLHNMITTFQDQRGGAETYANSEEIIARLKEEIKHIRQNPNLPVANSTRRLRQRYFKVKHQERNQKKESINLELSLACPTPANVEPLQIIYPSNYSGYEEIYDGFVSDSDEQEQGKDA
ncbi:protein RKD1 [Artemisia annua]|uniref:Protein RKD1 n=1 Tax=Artemisia annua TaxID=35608 RepID=A0A2U1N589_ARTAN|nr:protein RKD1 [Artemisia annua]